MDDELTFSLSILPEENIYTEEQLELALEMRQELLNGPVLSVERSSSAEAPAYSKGGAGLTPDLVVTLAVAAIPSVILLIQNWMLRHRDQKLRMKIKEIELEIPQNTTKEELDQLVKAAVRLAKQVK